MKKFRRNTVCNECMNRSNERGMRIEAYYDNLRYEYEKKRDGWLKPNFGSQPQYDEIVIRVPKHLKATSITIQIHQNIQEDNKLDKEAMKYIITSKLTRCLAHDF